MQQASEVRDIPFLKNDMAEPQATMGKNLETADAPGRADTELGEDELPEASAQNLR